jgi:dihydroorotase
VDLHTHLREPGREEAETIATGSRAAAAGGYTAIVAMPNTEPPHDHPSVVEFVRRRGEEAGLCEVAVSGCITRGREGREMAPLAALAAAGVTLFTDDGNGVQDPLLMRRALETAADLGVTLAQHCEVSSLTDGAVMHEGCCSGRLGLPGWPSIAEELMVHRDIELVRLTGARMHFLHLSCAGSVELVRRAKSDGLPVTCEVAPHHLALMDELLADFDPLYKVNPPLRTPADAEALVAGLHDGTIDAVATDHAPHTAHSKESPLADAPPGMIGLETALGVVNTVTGLAPVDIARVMSWSPARIASLAPRHGSALAPGSEANIVVWDPTTTWRPDAASMRSKSRNMPYGHMELRGRVRHTLHRGRMTHTDGGGER